MPVTLAQAKAQLQIDNATTDWDDLMTGLIAAAVSHIDGWNGSLSRCLIEQTWTQTYAEFDSELELPFPDVSAVVVQYYDASDALQTMDADSYSLVQTMIGSVIALSSAVSTPSVSAARADPVIITMTVGYGAAEDVPAAIKQAILLMVGHWFANREAVNVGNIVSELPFGATALLAPYRWVGV